MYCVLLNYFFCVCLNSMIKLFCFFFKVFFNTMLSTS